MLTVVSFFAFIFLLSLSLCSLALFFRVNGLNEKSLYFRD
jgi:hypothetical protein